MEAQKFKVVRNGYTEGEVKLIVALGKEHMIDHIDSPSTLYRICVEHAFINNSQGPHIEALRNVYRSIFTCTHYRHTNEFEELTKF